MAQRCAGRQSWPVLPARGSAEHGDGRRHGGAVQTRGARVDDAPRLPRVKLRTRHLAAPTVRTRFGLRTSHLFDNLLLSDFNFN